MAEFEGEIWLTTDDRSRLALEQLGLLEAIAATGSISAAAKATGISYKTAWDRLERLNNLSRNPLVTRSSGGNKGGGTQLTAYGRQLVAGFAELQAQHQQFLAGLNRQLHSLDDIKGFMQHSTLSASARNQFLGTVRDFETGNVNTGVVLDIADSLQLVAQITERSRQEMGLQQGDSVLALIKASSVTLAIGETVNVSARNCFHGVISRLERGGVNTDVSIDLGGSKTLGAMVTNTSSDQMGLMVGAAVIAFFKASSIILMRA